MRWEVGVTGRVDAVALTVVVQVWVSARTVAHVGVFVVVARLWVGTAVDNGDQRRSLRERRGVATCVKRDVQTFHSEFTGCACEDSLLNVVTSLLVAVVHHNGKRCRQGVTLSCVVHGHRRRRVREDWCRGVHDLNRLFQAGAVATRVGRGVRADDGHGLWAIPSDDLLRHVHIHLTQVRHGEFLCRNFLVALDGRVGTHCQCRGGGVFHSHSLHSHACVATCIHSREGAGHHVVAFAVAHGSFLTHCDSHAVAVVRGRRHLVAHLHAKLNGLVTWH